VNGNEVHPVKELLGGTETLEGTVKRITFQNEENGYTIATLQTEKNKEPVAIVGTMPGISGGEHLRVTGRWNRHEKFGLQLLVDTYERVLPVTKDGVLKFLASGSVKGVGPATAKKLVDRFGLQTLDVLEREPSRLQEIEGIGKVKAETIARSFQEHRGVQSVMVYLGTRGVTPAIANKLYRKYGSETITVLEDNPYRVVDEVPGIGFKTADRLAQLLGLTTLAPARLKVGMKHLLRQAADEGHVYLPEAELLAKAADLLGDECRPHLPDALETLRGERYGGVIVEDAGSGGRLAYLSGFYFAETKVAEKVRELIAAPDATGLSADEMDDDVLAEIEAEHGLSLAPLQRQAVEAVLRERLVVVTGGPGTGKTTTLRAIIAALNRQRIQPVLAAPTGRAAKRMTESTGVEAKTLHRLLEYGNAEGEGLKFGRNEENRLEGAMFIVDEASMIDLLLFFQLLRALPDGARLVLCGDIDQLPSVGAGAVLQDIIDSERVEVVRLQTIFRQAEESLIVKNAHRINHGQWPEAKKDGDFFFLEEEQPDGVVNLLTDLASRRLPSFLKADPVEDLQVLVPMRRGSLGVEVLNEHLQASLNPPGTNKAELRHGGRILRVGDKVMQIRNQYQKEVFNGDIGRIAAVDPEEGEVVVAYQDSTEPRHVTYSANELDELSLAYAITVHKSQGSEYPCVILPLAMQHRVMLQRNLLYTAVTRAKRLVVIVGTKRALKIAVQSREGRKRYSRLVERIRQ
jgi:exodeoxyribonuclease V alpha subunit